MSEFTCYGCDQTFDKTNDETWNDFKAAEEMLMLYPEDKNAPTEILCDDCHERFRTWLSTLTEDEKIRMRQEFYEDKDKD